MGLSLKTGPTEKLLTLKEAKLHLRIDHDDDDSLISSLIIAATTQAEQYTNRAFLSQSWELYLDAPRRIWDSIHRDDPRHGRNNHRSDWWDGTREGHVGHFLGINQIFFYLPNPPSISITEVETFDNDNTGTTFSASNYFLDSNSSPGRIIFNSDAILPINMRAYNAMRIEYVAGYGTSRSDVPNAIKQAALILLGHLYESRGTCDDTTKGSAMPSAARILLEPYQTKRTM